ncbi:MAG: NADH-quinone oxidoreductase subunit N [Cyclobacteriaceae bacterium]|nr:NADH-quinone oxidoreductase subunit N [Cyclobacteriaceae bacterium HetDA_MAG_MS6]
MDLLTTLETIIAELTLLQSEIAILSGAILLLVVGLFRPPTLVLKAIFGITLLAGFLLIGDHDGLVLNQFVQLDRQANIFKYLILASTLALLLFPSHRFQNVEYYFLLLSAVVGSFFMIDAHHLLITFLALELTSFASYILTNFRFRRSSFEASIKYLLLGAVSSAIMLYGISLLYGASGGFLLAHLPDSKLSIVGLLLFSVGVLFKTSVAPFHIWTPATYQETPTEVVAFFSVVPKVAGLILILHIQQALPESLQSDMILFWMGLALVTVVIGTFGAIYQKHATRLMAYGAIAHSGFLLPMVVLSTEMSFGAFVYYAVVYAVMNMGIFYFLSLHDQHQITELRDFGGYGKQYPWLGAAIVVVLIALTGLPPTAGFTAKLFLFSTVWSYFHTSGSLLILTYFVIGILSTGISLYYYLRIPYQYFLTDGRHKILKVSKVQIVLVTFFAVVLLLLFTRPDILGSFVVTYP